MKCFRCGRYGHFANSCFASTSYSGKTLYDDPILSPGSKRQEHEDMKCFRCGRYGHFADSCFASTSYSGKTLYDDHFSSRDSKRQKHEEDEMKCFRCGRYGHLVKECFATLSSEESYSKCQKEIDTNKTEKRKGVYVLVSSSGQRYVGKSNDIDYRIQQHKNGEVSATAHFKGILRETHLLSSQKSPSDLESWERNEFLAQVSKYGTEKVRGWKYVSRDLNSDEEDCIASDLCEKYDLCRICGFKGHFADECPLK
jgi:predicted GIY-YIG superfamily endonuclease